MLPYRVIFSRIFVFFLVPMFISCTNDSTDLIFNTGEDGALDDKRLRFTKIAKADWRLAENQDRITPNLWLTRADEGLLFNAKIENKPDGSGPSGTKWFLGSLDDYTEEQLGALEFVSMKRAAGSKMRDVPGKSFIVHLVEDDAFIELTFLSWGNKSEGAGYSYLRTNLAE